MLFEGSEKKIEVVVSKSAGSMREYGEFYWEDLVERAGATVLSKISNAQCDAYLLSESSLFVWDDKVIMITCGQTTLVSALLTLLDRIEDEHLLSVIYERKNEYFPHHQYTDFFGDFQILRNALKGRAFLFGEQDGHHLYLFHLEKDFLPPASDQTFELLMYDLDADIQTLFLSEGTSAQEVREKMEFDRLFPGFQIDDYVFEPQGYSLNAIKEDLYYTIHVTPQNPGTYVSFETNMPAALPATDIAKRVISAFKASTFDIVDFRPKLESEPVLPGFVKKCSTTQSLGCGYDVHFSHFFKPQDQPRPAFELLGQNHV